MSEGKKPQRVSSEEYEEVKKILESVGSTDPLDKMDELPLIYKAKQGDKEAMHRLIQAHIRFIVNVAATRGSRTIPLQDRVQDGILGLMDAVQRYNDPSGQTPLMAFARWRILMHTQREERSYREPPVDVEAFGEAASPEDDIDAAEERMSSPTLERVLKTFLTDREQRVITALYLSGRDFSPEEVARTEGLDPLVVEGIRQSALEKLRDFWAPEERVVTSSNDDYGSVPQPADETGIRMMAVAEIKVGSRIRQDLGEISDLAESIRALGLLNPITVTAEGQLIAGRRRLEAVRLLGWKRVPIRILNA